MLRKPRSVRGRQLLFRDAAVDDAAFILGLRTDEKKGEFLSATAPDQLRQRDWLARYAADAGQVYFIICTLDGTPVGTVRLYDQRGDSFCWGSWIKGDGAPGGFGVESALMVYDFALRLGFKRAHFDVRKQNTSVCRFHERFGAVKVAENAEDYFYEMSNDAINGALAQYKKYLPDGAAIEF